MRPAWCSVFVSEAAYLRAYRLVRLRMLLHLVVKGETITISALRRKATTASSRSGRLGRGILSTTFRRGTTFERFAWRPWPQPTPDDRAIPGPGSGILHAADRTTGRTRRNRLAHGRRRCAHGYLVGNGSSANRRHGLSADRAVFLVRNQHDSGSDRPRIPTKLSTCSSAVLLLPLRCNAGTCTAALRSTC